MKSIALFRSLKSRNYRLYFTGQSISQIGGWMALTATMWLAYRLTENAFYVGLIGFASQIPLLFMSPFTSVIGDRVDRRRFLISLQLCTLVQVSALAAVTLSGNVTISIMIALASVQGVINAFDFPIRQSFVAEMVNDRADLPSAVALNSTLFNVARLIGPTLAGLVIARWGEGICYVINAVGFLAVITSFLKMRVKPRPPRPGRTRPMEDFRNGLSYVRNEGRLMRPMLLVAIAAFAGFGSHTLAPVFARTIFEGDASLLGRFYSIVGIGALTGAIIMGTRSSPASLRWWVVFGMFETAVGTLIVALSKVLWLTYLGYLIGGMAIVMVMVGCNTLIQFRVDDDKRSRIMGLFVMATGVAPIGQFFTGWAASTLGTRQALVICAVILATGAAVFAKRRSPIDEDSGQMPTSSTPLPPAH